MPTDEHLSAAHLVRVAGNQIDDDERRQALSHLEECEECGDRLATILLLRQGRRTRALGGGHVAVLAAAASLTLIVAAWALYISSVAAPEAPTMTAEQELLAQRWGGYASRENIDDLLYDFVLRIVYPDVVAVSPDQRDRRTRIAVVAIRNEDYQEAIDELIELNLEYPEFDSIAGWLGVALHLSGETDPLVERLLDRGTDSGITLLQEMGLWYGAHQLLLTGRPQAAVQKLSELAQTNDHMGRLARSLLAEMPLDELELGEEQRVPFA